MEKYYFEIDAELNCKEECEYSKHIECGEVIDIKIGSLLCKQCEHNVSYCGDENWIKCEVYSSFAEVELLKDKVIELNKIIDDQKKVIIDFKKYEETVIGLFENNE